MTGNDKTEKIEVVIITGLSGAGKTSAADWFEDRGYYCIDNMPPSLIEEFLEICYYGGGIKKVAFVIDVRSEAFFADLRSTIGVIRHSDRFALTVLFVEASTPTLLKRFSATRRVHPLAKGRTTAAVIERERSMMENVRQTADRVIDTSRMKVADFYTEISSVFTEGGNAEYRFSVNVMSFGYKYGLPQECDLLMDVRFLPNPFYLTSLRKLTGNNKKVRQYVMKFPESKEFIRELDQMLSLMIPHHIAQGKYHLNLAFGCTGGQHRSVAIANEMAEILRREGYRVTLEHREL